MRNGARKNATRKLTNTVKFLLICIWITCLAMYIANSIKINMMRRQQLKESIGKSEFDLFKTMKELKNILEISEKEREKMKIDLEKRSLGKRSHEPTKELLYSKLSYAQTEIQTASKRTVLEK